MKILYISPENTVGTLSVWKQFHESNNNSCEFITFYKTPNGFDSGLCLNLPFISTGLFYRKLRKLYYRKKYGKNGEYSIKPGNPPEWIRKSWIEKIYFAIRDWIWNKNIKKKLSHLNLLDFDVYHFEWGLDFDRSCSLSQQIANMGKPIICTYHGQDLRTRGVIEPLNSLSDKNFTSELDLLSMHPKIEYMFLPIAFNDPLSIKKTKKQIKICHSPTNRYYKGSKQIVEICEQVANQYPHVEFILIEGMPNKKVLEIKRTCDILIDQVGNYGGWGYGMNSIEAMALGLCCMTEMNKECINFFNNHPFININEANLKETLIQLINNPLKIDSHKLKSLEWVKNNHDIKKVGLNLYSKYQEIMNEK